jgi:hypothetical protein
MKGPGAERMVRMVEEWIPLADKSRLSARIWLPEDSARDPVPALLEYIPYRKSDWTVARDSARHPYFAARGYASIRIDLRGSGDSDGILRDEYLPQEQLDAVEAIRWIADQTWCTGAVGMFGTSWGGFNCLQVAARRPPELRAIITSDSADDLYGGDVHYLGGCLLGAGMPAWGADIFAFCARPPDPQLVGSSWREMWLERLEANRPFIETWIRHQRRDEYWKQGSVCEDPGAIEAAVYAVGGWADPYRTTVLRLLKTLRSPCKGLIGPWPHRYPDQLYGPGPTIDFLAESIRWWDYWLKGIDTGVMDEPALRVWMQESVPPRAYYAVRPGRWVAEDQWPSPRINPRRLFLGDGTLTSEPETSQKFQIAGAQAAGLAAGRLFPMGNSSELPPDQRSDDGLSLCFTSEPLVDRLEILGVPEVALRLASDRPLALVAVRLCEIAPTGESLLVTRGMLNIAHRDGHDRPAPLVPGRWYEVRVRLNAIAHAFPPGHRIRVAVSPTYWPWAWPSPEPVTLSVESGVSSLLELPERRPRTEDEHLRPFEEREPAPSALDTGRGERIVELDFATGLVRQVVNPKFGFAVAELAGGLEYGELAEQEYSIVEGDPLSASVRCQWRISIGRGEWRTRIETESTMTADAASFHLENTLRAFEGDSQVFQRIWTDAVSRDHI